MRWSRMLGPVAAASVLVSTLVGCGSDDEREQLADDLVAETRGALDDDQADCVAAALDEEFGDESFRTLIDAARRPAGEDDGEVRTRVIDIFADCDALGAVVGGD